MEGSLAPYAGQSAVDGVAFPCIAPPGVCGRRALPRAVLPRFLEFRVAPRGALGCPALLRVFFSLPFVLVLLALSLGGLVLLLLFLRRSFVTLLGVGVPGGGFLGVVVFLAGDGVGALLLALLAVLVGVLGPFVVVGLVLVGAVVVLAGGGPAVLLPALLADLVDALGLFDVAGLALVGLVLVVLLADLVGELGLFDVVGLVLVGALVVLAGGGPAVLLPALLADLVDVLGLFDVAGLVLVGLVLVVLLADLVDVLGLFDVAGHVLVGALPDAPPRGLVPRPWPDPFPVALDLFLLLLLGVAFLVTGGFVAAVPPNHSNTSPPGRCSCPRPHPFLVDLADHLHLLVVAAALAGGVLWLFLDPSHGLLLLGAHLGGPEVALLPALIACLLLRWAPLPCLLPLVCAPGALVLLPFSFVSAAVLPHLLQLSHLLQLLPQVVLPCV